MKPATSLERSVSDPRERASAFPIGPAVIGFAVFTAVAVLAGQPWRGDGSSGMLRLALPTLVALVMTAYLARRSADTPRAWALPFGFAICAVAELVAIAWILVVR